MVYKTREEMLKTLGSNLRALRLADNLSQQTLAERSGISLKAVRNLEAGENSSTLSLLSYGKYKPKARRGKRQNGGDARQSPIKNEFFGPLLSLALTFA